MNIFESPYLLTYIQLSTNYMLSIRYNYLLVYICRLRFISNLICKLSVLIYKLRNICIGYNGSYKQGSTARLLSYKYQVPSNSQHISHTSTRANTHVYISLNRSLKFTFTHIYVLSLNSYIYLNVRILCFAGLSSCPLDKDYFQNQRVKFKNSSWSRLSWRVPTLNFDKYHTYNLVVAL